MFDIEISPPEKRTPREVISLNVNHGRYYRSDGYVADMIIKALELSGYIIVDSATQKPVQSI